MNSLQRQIKLQFCFLLLALYMVLCPAYSYAQDKIVAIVNNEIITQKDLNDFVQFMRMQLSSELKGKELETKIQSMKVDLLNKLIEDRLILQKAKKSNIKVNETMAQAKIEEIRKRYPSEQVFQEALSRQGLVQADMESRIQEQLLTGGIVEQEVKNKININPSEVTQFYEKNAKEFNLPEEREFESVSIPEEKLAGNIYRELKNGADLNSLTNQYSLAINKLSASAPGELRKDIEGLIFQLKEGEISQPLKIEGSYYIFKLDKINPGRVQTLSEAKDRISVYLFNMKMQEALVKWLDELKKQAYIKILID